MHWPPRQPSQRPPDCLSAEDCADECPPPQLSAIRKLSPTGTIDTGEIRAKTSGARSTPTLVAGLYDARSLAVTQRAAWVAGGFGGCPTTPSLTSGLRVGYRRQHRDHGDGLGERRRGVDCLCGSKSTYGGGDIMSV
jgi:hypothetical protein